MLNVDLIRHVKVEGKSALYGVTDVAPIKQDNDDLLQRLIANQQTESAYQHIICSPLQRCQTLARKIAERCKLPLAINENLQEMNFGIFDGIPFDDMVFDKDNVDKENSDKKHTVKVKSNNENSIEDKAVHWSVLERFFQAPSKVVLPQGERLADFNHRVIQAWQQLIEQEFVKIAKQNTSSECSQKTPVRILVIAHGGVIRMILAHILQADWQQASWHQNLDIGHASLTRICVSNPIKAISIQKIDKEDESIQEKQSNRQECLPLEQRLQKHQQKTHQHLHQKVLTIAMPQL